MWDVTVDNDVLLAVEGADDCNNYWLYICGNDG